MSSSSPMGFSVPVADHPPEIRSRFMTRVYGLVLGGIGAFMALEYFLFSTGIAETIAELVIDTNWLIILGGFMVVSWLANNLGDGRKPRSTQLAGYFLLIGANALLFAAPLWIANQFYEGVITQAAVLSVLAFAGLSLIAITTSKDFSFLRSVLMWGGVLALALIVGSVIFSVALGLWFSVAMIGFAGAAILYSTQRVYRSYPPDMEIAAAMNLLSSLALLFWYVLQLLMRR